MSDIRSNHSNNPRLYYKARNTHNHNHNQNQNQNNGNQPNIVPNHQRNIFTSSATAVTSTNIIDKILPNQWLVDSVPQI